MIYLLLLKVIGWVRYIMTVYIVMEIKITCPLAGLVQPFAAFDPPAGE
jgi:hypothetical protein